jgi:hypothetical protein
MQDQAMDNALATDGYFFSSEPFLYQPYIEATQLACLLGCSDSNQAEVILEARSLDQTEATYQLTLSGTLEVHDQDNRKIDLEKLRQLPIEQLSEQQLQEKGWTINKRPSFVWLKQFKPLNQGNNRIYSSAFDQLNQLKEILCRQQPA